MPPPARPDGTPGADSWPPGLVSKLVQEEAHGSVDSPSPSRQPFGRDREHIEGHLAGRCRLRLDQALRQGAPIHSAPHLRSFPCHAIAAEIAKTRYETPGRQDADV